MCVQLSRAETKSPTAVDRVDNDIPNSGSSCAAANGHVDQG